METTESTSRARGQLPPAGPDPLTRQLLRLMAASDDRHAGRRTTASDEQPACQGLDSITVMELVSAWHRRGVEVGFPELMSRPARDGRHRP
ncbi:phosphopantetheine attachment domain protein [Streptomyces hilarionis]|uniref:phosphopantetheine attachment domain protein n=1 Tax=Streptomyces hilarionis TaxID=2839954 RepID=UPI00211A4D4D|nr:phosphopantetheine attachment domain protein [Streptomyces hilarionis]MCQ9131920.1 phosphopantetheine attachment domain protein [Streptomyces hilarionis]